MIELKFETEEEAQFAVKELSYLGKIEVRKVVENYTEEKLYLTSNYDDALLKLKEQKIEDISEYSISVLKMLKTLFESNEFQDNRNLNLPQIEAIILKIASESGNEKFLEYIKAKEEFKEKIESIKEYVSKDDDNDTNQKQFAIDQIPQLNDTNFDNFLEMNQLGNLLINPIYDSLTKHLPAEDPYSSFMNEVYLDVTEFREHFDITELRLKLNSEIFVSYTLNVGLEFIFQEDEFFEILEGLPLQNTNVIEDIQTMLVLAKTIILYIENVKKIKYQKLIKELYELINAKLISFDEIDLEFNIDTKIIELIIKDLARIKLIELIGKKIVKYKL